MEAKVLQCGHVWPEVSASVTDIWQTDWLNGISVVDQIFGLGISLISEEQVTGSMYCRWKVIHFTEMSRIRLCILYLWCVAC